MVKEKRKARVWEAGKPKEKKKRVRKIKKVQSIEESQVIISDERQEMIQSVKNNTSQIEQNFEFFKEQSVEIQKQEQIKHKIQEQRLIRDILFSQINYVQNESRLNISQRKDDIVTISTFIDTCSSANKLTSQLLYLYGTPGIGKTFLIRNILIHKGLLERTVWVNCFQFLSESTVNFNVKEADLQGQKKIIVLDQFDQLASWLLSKTFEIKFRGYLQNFQNSGSKGFILISNRSFDQKDQNLIQNIKTILNYSKMIQIPFPPYSLKQITSIITSKCNQIEQHIPNLIFNYKLLVIAITKINSTTQDIRKVINFIIQNYALLLVGTDSQELSRGKFIQEITQNKISKDQNQNMQCSYLRLLEGRQKILLKNVIVEYEEVTKNGKVYLSQKVYVQGRKLGINTHTVDLWVQEWTQMSILKKSAYRPKKEHIFQATYQIESLLSMQEYKKYFY